MSYQVPVPRQAPNELERAQSDRLIRALEIPDCRCPVLLSCRCRGECRRGPGGGVRPRRHWCPCCRGECDCLPADHQPPCRHVLAVVTSLTVAELAWLLLALHPAVYAEPEDPPDAVPCMLTELQRVGVMVRRHVLEYGLYHVEDGWRQLALRAGLSRPHKAHIDQEEVEEEVEEEGWRPPPLLDWRKLLLAEVRADLAHREAQRVHP